MLDSGKIPTSQATQVILDNPEVLKHLGALTPLLDCIMVAAVERLFIYDPDRRLLYVSPQVLEAFGMTRETMLGKTWRELGQSDDYLLPFETQFQHVVSTGQPATGIEAFEVGSHRREWTFALVPVMGVDGRPQAVVATARDVTDERAAQEALRQSEEKFRALSEAAFEGVAIHDQGRIVLGNQAFATAFGYEIDELIGRSVLELAAPQSRNLVIANIQSGIETPYQAWGLRKDGSVFPGELRSCEIMYRGKLHRVTALRDISESKRVEDALRASEARWRALIENAPSIIMTIDRDERITFINRVVPGYRLEDVIGAPMYRYLNIEDHGRIRSLLRSVLDEGRSHVYDIDVTTPTGEMRTFQANMSPIELDRMVREAIIVGTDVTESRRAASELASQRAELEKARELDRVKSNFVNAVTHELRTPLTSIMGYSEFLEDAIGGSLTDTQQEFVHQIQAGTRRLQNLVDDLLDFARLEAGTFKLKLQDADLADKVRAIANSLRPQIKDAGLTLELDLPEQPVCFPVDAQRIGQVLTNILINGIKFTDAGGQIRVSLRVEGDHVRLEVQDTGFGIAPEDVPKLFQRFSQLERGRRMGGGTGLGLSISKALIETHGGQIGVDSAPGQGSTFWFTLPLRPPEPQPSTVENPDDLI